MANKKGNKSEKVVGLKKLDVLNSEGPVILATRRPGSDEVELKFDNENSTLKINLKELLEFFYMGRSIVNPSDETDIYIYENFSTDMRPSRDTILEFFND